MKVSISYSEIWRISWPIMLSSMANTVINFTDVAFVSRIGEKELAASALGGIFYFLLVMISVAIGIGTQILIARRAGEDRHAEIGTVFDNGFLMLMVFAVLMSGLLYLFVPGLIPLIVDDPEVAVCGSRLSLRQRLGSHLYDRFGCPQIVVHRNNHDADNYLYNGGYDGAECDS
jgi:Na+-driven multidrug efflux pump